MEGNEANTNRVFLVRQHYQALNQGTRGVMVAVACLTLITSTYAFRSSNNMVIKPQTNFDFKVSQLKIISSATNVRDRVPVKLICLTPLVQSELKWHLPPSFTYSSAILNGQNRENYSSSELILTVYNKTREPLVVRCSRRSRFNSKDLEITSINLQLIYKPEVLAVEQSWQYGVGGKGLLTCIVNAFPEAEVEWFFNDVFLGVTSSSKSISGTTNKIGKTSLRHKTEHNTNGSYEVSLSELIVKDIIYADYGVYACLPKNAIGEADKRGTFNLIFNSGRIGDKCLDNTDCDVEGSVCHYKSNSCECRHGFVIKRSIDKNVTIETCMKVGSLFEECDESMNCMENNSVCDEILKRCRCSNDTIYIHHRAKDKCLKRKGLFEKCEENEQCSTSGSFCNKFKYCDCRSNYKYSWKNNRELCVVPKYLYSDCSSTQECHSGGFPKSVCRHRQCQCQTNHRYMKKCNRCEEPKHLVENLRRLIVRYLYSKHSIWSFLLQQNVNKKSK